MPAEFNVLAVFAASLAAMVIGGLWYSPLLFEKPWRKLTGTTENSRKRNPVIIYGGSFLLMLLAAAIFHAFLGPKPDLMFSAGVGFSAGLAWAAGSLWIGYLFEGRSMKLGLINGGYNIAQYTIYGIVFGLM